MARWITELTYLAALGQVSEILDTQSNRRILVAGTNHQARAQTRADILNAEEEARLRPAPPRRRCCPPDPIRRP